MSELQVFLPRPARAAKQRRCAEGLSVQTMLHDPDHCQSALVFVKATAIALLETHLDHAQQALVNFLDGEDDQAV